MAQRGANIEVLAADLNGDGFADILERNVDTGELTARLNLGYGGGNTFSGRVAIGFVTMTGPEWTVLVADFDGDHRADIADYHRPSGYFWIHRNTSSGNGISFDPADWGMGQGYGAAGWKVIVGDFTGDGRADFADLNTATGEFWVHLNYGNGTFQPQGTSSGYARSYRPNTDWKFLGE